MVSSGKSFHAVDMELRRAAVGRAGQPGERVREVSKRAAVEGLAAVGEVCIRGKRRRNLDGVEEEEEEEECGCIMEGAGKRRRLGVEWARRAVV
ncbi:hypothetical protein PRUPE_3G145300 [Prunus persica]|uniref:Uncharacterized protein n=1 Tax=Prunus persica TaxID=3760 RepID=A0A251Q0B6_PRUPE|nr:hypothetical protein PRUPE_3G145300 [Prunus persica]